MIVNNVQEHHQPQSMGGIDQLLQIVRRPVSRIRSVRQHAIVAPVALAGKIVDRHQLDRRHPQFLQTRQIVPHAAKAAGGSGMHLVQHDLGPGAPPPVGIFPLESAGLNNAGVVDVRRLTLRRRVRHHQPVRQAIPISCTIRHRRRRLEPSVAGTPHRQQIT